MYAVGVNTTRFGEFDEMRFESRREAVKREEQLIELMWDNEREYVEWDDINRIMHQIKNNVYFENIEEAE